MHADKSQLEGQLSELQKQQQQELEDLQNRLNQSIKSSDTPSTDRSGPPDQDRPQRATECLPTTRGGDSRQLAEHAAALQRLEELQQTMVGGERAGDSGLQQGLMERRKKAEGRRELLLIASRAADEDDGIIEGIFNSLTGR